MTGFINVGFGNILNMEKLVAIVSPDAAPIKRLVQKAKEENRVIDATSGRKTRAVLVMDHNQIILSALQPDTLHSRIQENF